MATEIILNLGKYSTPHPENMERIFKIINKKSLCGNGQQCLQC